MLRWLLCLLLLGLTGVPAWAHCRPETRVGGSPVFSSIFASQETAKSIGTPSENGGCGYDFASGVHKYLYTQDNPVDGIDPSGNDDIGDVLGAMDIGGMLDSIGVPMGAKVLNMAQQLGGINVDVYVWEWKNLGVIGPGQHSVGHVMVIDDGTQNVEVSQFPHGVGEPSKPKGPNHTLSFSDTSTEEQGRTPDAKFFVHLPNPTAFHARVDNETKRQWWDWDPHGPNETQCARAGYDVLKAGGLPLWGYGDQGLIMPGWLTVKLNQFVHSSSQTGGYSVKRIN
jgi:hypothetical protein